MYILFYNNIILIVNNKYIIKPECKWNVGPWELFDHNKYTNYYYHLY